MQLGSGQQLQPMAAIATLCCIRKLAIPSLTPRSCILRPSRYSISIPERRTERSSLATMSSCVSITPTRRTHARCLRILRGPGSRPSLPRTMCSWGGRYRGTRLQRLSIPLASVDADTKVHLDITDTRSGRSKRGTREWMAQMTINMM